jgi:hypothetical protein
VVYKRTAETAELRDVVRFGLIPAALGNLNNERIRSKPFALQCS